MLQVAQDPDELFDVVTAAGEATGITKRRADVHRDGDWHRCVHVWIYGEDANGPFLLLQRRGMEKDTWPGALDVPVGGHLNAGESLSDAFREVEEEVGIHPDPALLIHVGARRGISEHPPHWLDRELQEIFLLRDDRPLSGYRPDPAELDSLVRLPLQGTLDLLAGTSGEVIVEVMSAQDHRQSVTTLTLSSFMPTVDRYFYRVAVAVSRALRNEPHLVV